MSMACIFDHKLEFCWNPEVLQIKMLKAVL